MRRITTLGCTATAAYPLAARAQQPNRMRRIGVLTPFVANDAEGQARLTAFARRVCSTLVGSSGKTSASNIAGAMAGLTPCANTRPNWSCSRPGAGKTSNTGQSASKRGQTRGDKRSVF